MATEDVFTVTRWGSRWRVANSIQRRVSQSAFLGLGMYATMSLAFLIAAVMVHNDLRFAERNSVFISREPLAFPILITVIVTSIYLAMSTAVLVSREREQGTLETLFFGPVDELAFVLGYFLAQLRVYFGLVLVIILWTNLVTWVLNLRFSLAITVLSLTSVVATAVVISFGLLVAMWGKRTRRTLLFFILVIALILGLQVSDIVISGIALATSATANDPILVIRNVLSLINLYLVNWISPFSQLRLLLDALTEGNVWSYFYHLAVLVGQTAVLLTAAVWSLKRTGVRSQ